MKKFLILTLFLGAALFSFGQTCVKQPKLFVDGRELPIDQQFFNTYVLNLCSGQTKKLTFSTQNQELKYYIGKSTGEAIFNNATFPAETAASKDVAFDQVVAGNYTVIVYSGTDPNTSTCKSDPITLRVDKDFFGPTIIPDYTASRDTCFNTTITLGARGSQGTLLWSKNDGTPEERETYTFTLTTKTNIKVSLVSTESCAIPNTASGAIDFTPIPAVNPTVRIDTVKPPICEGDEVRIILIQQQNQGKYPTYRWLVNGVEQQEKDVSNGLVLKDWKNGTRVELELTKNDGCASVRTVISNKITLRSTSSDQTSVKILEIKNSLNDTVVCKGTEVTLSPVTNKNGLRYTWKAPGLLHYDSLLVKRRITQKTTFVVSAFFTGCATGTATDSITFTIADSAGLSINNKQFGAQNYSICEGDSAILTAHSSIPNSTLIWTKNNQQLPGKDSSVTIKNLATGDVIKVQTSLVNSCGRTASDSILISTTRRPLTGFTEGVGPISYCKISDVQLTANETNPALEYKWRKDGLDLQTPLSNTYKLTEPGFITLTIGSGSCTSKTSIQVKPIVLTVKAGPTGIQFTPGELVELTAEVENPSSKPVSYAWTPSAFLSDSDRPTTMASPSETTTYKIIVSTSDGCEAFDMLTLRKRDTIPVIPVDTSIVLPPEVKPETELKNIFVPNAFMPSTLDQNAYWGIAGTENYPEIVVKVYNRWGTLVYETKGYTKAWDGTVNGKDLPSGTYYYHLSDPSFDRPMVGDVTIIR